MKVEFNDIPLLKIANGAGTIARYPDSCKHLITIDLIDPETDCHVGCMDFNIDEAIALRDWLIAAIPSQSDALDKHG